LPPSSSYTPSFFFILLLLLLFHHNTEFILLGFTDDPNLQVPLLLVFFNLSFVDPGHSSAVAPQTVAAPHSGNKLISHNGCAPQSFFFVGFATVKCYLLASTACDPHAVLCRPLHYTTIMIAGVYALLRMGSYVCGFLNACGLLDACIHSADTFRLSFCGSNEMNHFFCEVPPLLALSCSNTCMSKLVAFFVVGFNVFFTLLVILISYFFIYIATILRVNSSGGRVKAFSTCSSQLTAVAVFFGTLIFMYLQSGSGKSLEEDKVVSVFYSVVIPMLSPVIYSLRNKDVKAAFRKVTGRFQVSQSV
uniref:Olfactory receptor family 5 subfamily B member 21 n=1 Tax=Monodon monoceros TaxID=40151 RepID=A0A8C6CCJ5_MONMO